MKENKDEGEWQGRKSHLDTRGQGERGVRFQERELSIWVGPQAKLSMWRIRGV